MITIIVIISIYIYINKPYMYIYVYTHVYVLDYLISLVFSGCHRILFVHLECRKGPGVSLQGLFAATGWSMSFFQIWGTLHSHLILYLEQIVDISTNIHVIDALNIPSSYFLSWHVSLICWLLVALADWTRNSHSSGSTFHQASRNMIEERAVFAIISPRL